MDRRDEEREAELRNLRTYSQETWLKDVKLTSGLRDRILSETVRNQAAHASLKQGSADPEHDNTSAETRLRPHGPSRHGGLRAIWRNRLAPFGAALVACVMLGAGFAAFHDLHRPHPGVVEVGQPPSDPWNTGFGPIPQQLVQDQFSHVRQITVSLGGQQPSVQNFTTVTVSLTVKEQRELRKIMQSAEIDTTNQVDTSPLLYQISFFSKLSSMEGSFAANGLMYLPGDMRMGQGSTGNIFKANPQLAGFIQRIAINRLEKQLEKHGKILSSTANEAALEFTHHLAQPKVAYRYSIPSVHFSTDMSFQILAQEAEQKGFADYHVASVTKLDTGDALVRLTPIHPGWFSTALELRVTPVGRGWLVTEVGTTLNPQSYMGSPPYGPIGKDRVLIIGHLKPQGLNLPYTMIGYQDTNASAYKTAAVLVFERQPLSGKSNAKADKIVASSKKLIPGHPDTHAVAALRNSPSFQRALAEVRTRHAILVVAGDEDGRLSRDTVVDAIRNVKSSTGYDLRQTQVVTVEFQSKTSAWFSGSTYVDNGKLMPFDASMLTSAIIQAAGQLDTGMG